MTEHTWRRVYMPYPDIPRIEINRGESQVHSVALAKDAST